MADVYLRGNGRARLLPRVTSREGGSEGSHGVAMGVHACWNAPFFGRQAVEANIVDIINRFNLVGGDLKLPKVRALSGKAAESNKEGKPEKPRLREIL
jgi:hypothetical protein